ncbi:MAG: ROK family protein [Actinomycetia bacterium]|nr:ROK family protein [Actinomycetes bacterium]MCP3909347.1 ROK family protein [Actinomycetes bacterium]MCP4086724.1 ROK family protein [Actinomycetes bacterium]
MSNREPSVIGIDVGGTKTLGLVIDAAGNVLLQEKWPTRQGAAAVTEMLAELAQELRSRIATTHKVRGLGVGLAGLVDSMGRLRRAPNLVDADEFAVRDLLEPRVGMPVLVDNDANCAARAELHAGVAVGVRHGVLITLGTGIGGALIVDGAVVRGAAGMAGEPGHMLVDPAGPKCVCGLSGCWERYASGAGLAYLGRRAADRGDLASLVGTVDGTPEPIRGEHITRAARLGDPEASAVLDEFAWWVSVGLANCAAMSDPEMIILGGGLVRDWDLFGPRVRRHLNEVLVAAEHRPEIRVEPAAAGEAAGALGAALLAADETGLRP